VKEIWSVAEESALKLKEEWESRFEK